MKTIKVKISIPQDLSDITLREYKKYDKILNANTEDPNSERFLQLKMVEIFCGLSYEEAAGMTLVDFQRVIETLVDILQQQPKLVRTFKLGEREFGFIPNLEEMTFGEYIDLDTYIGKIQEIEKAMAVLYRPIQKKVGDKYTIQAYEGDLLHETLLDMPMDAVVSSIVFFYHLGIDLSSVMMSYLPKEEIPEQLTGLVRSGVGINNFTQFQREILGDLKK